jgi:predicted O-methyltransferase YrrM
VAEVPLSIDARLTTPSLQLDATDYERMAEICRSVPGYSDAKHFQFFRQLFAYTAIETVLILGVYFGRDIAFMLEAARRAGRSVSITGVDKFSDDACEDWPQAVRGLSWQQAGFGAAPSLEAATANVERLGAGAEVRLIRRHDSDFLAESRTRYDLIYLDTSHDYETVVRQMRQAAPLLSPDGIMAGDDYSDAGTWGVCRAVSEAAPGHAVFGGWIWISTQEELAAGFAAVAA